MMCVVLSLRDVDVKFNLMKRLRLRLMMICMISKRKACFNRDDYRMTFFFS